MFPFGFNGSKRKHPKGCIEILFVGRSLSLWAESLEKLFLFGEFSHEFIVFFWAHPFWISQLCNTRGQSQKTHLGMLGEDGNPGFFTSPVSRISTGCVWNPFWARDWSSEFGFLADQEFQGNVLWKKIPQEVWEHLVGLRQVRPWQFVSEALKSGRKRTQN